MFIDSIRRGGSRLAAALFGATKGEVAKITEGLNKAIDAHLEKPTTLGAAYGEVILDELADATDPGTFVHHEAHTHKDGPRAVRRRRNRFRCSRNKKFHAKRGGTLQYGHVAHGT